MEAMEGHTVITNDLFKKVNDEREKRNQMRARRDTGLCEGFGVYCLGCFSPKI